MYMRPKYFLFNDTATTEIYTLSLHDALPICVRSLRKARRPPRHRRRARGRDWLSEAGSEPECGLGSRDRGFGRHADRKSTRLNSSHMSISYAVFCLKKKK